MMALDSHSLNSSSTSTGVRPVGLSARYSGARGLVTSTNSNSSGSLRWAATARTFQVFGEGRKSIQLHDRLL